ncbi:ribonuclease III [bacterium]|nr:ribonuclease III [bacterium]
MISPFRAFLKSKRKTTELEKRINYRFNDLSLLEKALSHQSFTHSKKLPAEFAYERLEFLGDAVIELIVCEHLYQNFPKCNEGELTKKKSVWVSRNMLTKRAHSLGLEQFIRLGNKEKSFGQRGIDSILSDVYEALVGAIFIDGGIKKAKEFVMRTHIKKTKDDILDDTFINYKGELIEHLQAKGFSPPTYNLEKEIGDKQSKEFVVSAWVGRTLLGRGKGESKKLAEQSAAKDALNNIKSGKVNLPESKGEKR